MSIDPRMTVCNPAGPGSAYYVRPSPSITRSEETASSPPTFQYVDVGTPNYAPAPDHQNIVFCLRSDANPPPPTRGIFIPAFSEGTIDESMEAPDDTPLALTPAGEVDSIALEFHWPGYMRYSVQITIAWRCTRGGRLVRRHISRSDLGKTIAEHAIRFVRMTLVESYAPPPVPFGTTSAPGVTTSDMLLRSLDPLISPEGRVVWVPHFAVRYPLSNGHLRNHCQRTRW